jgi:hypothetical protein
MDHLTAGDSLSATKLFNPLIDDFNKSQTMMVGAGLTIKNLPNGVFLALSNPSPYRLGMVTDKGNCTNATGTHATTGSSDYTDERYFIQWCAVSNLQADDFCTVAKFTAEPSTSQNYQIVTATNLNEMLGHTHSVTVGQVFLISSAYDAGSPPTLRYFFQSGGGAAPQGEIQFQGYQMLSNNQTGWDFQRSHSMLG